MRPRMSKRLTGRTVLIAGAAGGQGGAGALLFAREGANLALCDINRAGLDEVSERVSDAVPGTSILTGNVDMREIAEIETFVNRAAERFDAIDVIYNNAGVNHLAPIAAMTDDDWDRVHDINLKSSFFLVKYALPALKKSKGASVINVSSGAGWLAPAEGNTLYCSSKGGLIALSRAQARDLAPFNIRVNCLLPGPTQTPMVNAFFAAMPEEEQAAARATVLARSMFNRFGQPDEIAAVAVFLCTDEATYMTSAIIPVDAGWTSV
jgi:NAD(P)-dependent dehydrogenase (short-subunit alcohol dehydrogenase family)